MQHDKNLMQESEAENGITIILQMSTHSHKQVLWMFYYWDTTTPLGLYVALSFTKNIQYNAMQYNTKVYYI